MAYPKGIDISFAQVGVNYSSLCPNINFAIIKCGEKNYKDPQFDSHYNGCLAQKVTMGAYFYGRARTNQEAIEEAQLCASLVRDKKFTLPIFYDVEGEPGMAGILYPGPMAGYSVKSIVRTFLDELRNQGITSYGVYGNRAVFNEHLTESDFNDIYIWYANWTEQTTPPQVWGRYPDIWQYSSTVHYPGYSGNLDGDYLITQTFPISDNNYYYCHPFGMKAEKTILNTYSGHGAEPIDLSLSSAVTQGKLDTVGTPIYSLCDGIVINSSYTCGSTQKTSSPAGGNSVTIAATGTAAQLNNILDRPLQFLYCHLVNPNEQAYSHFPILKYGDTVRKGQIIGGMGASGNTDDGAGGPFAHLHLDTKARIKHDSETYNLYSNKLIHFQSYPSQLVGDIYNYAIFCEEPVLVSMYLENSSENSTELIKVHNVPNEYYANTITDAQITGNGAYTKEYIFDIITALSIRETIDYASANISDYAINCVAIYGKLLRARCIYHPNTSLMDILLAGDFSGFSQQRLASVADESIREKLLELVSNNLIYPNAYGILSDYIPLISYGPYYNYGYAGFGYSNSPTIESELTAKILNKNIKSHITLGNTDDLSGCCGNTAYFPPRTWI